MRQANIFYKNDLAGVLTENDAGYEFRYLPENVSLYETAGKIRLTPAYDLLNAVIFSDGLKETYNELLRERIDRLCR